MNQEEIFQSLERLRKVLLQMIIILIVVSITMFPFSKTLLHQLYETNLEVELLAEPHAQVSLAAFTIPEAFFPLLKLTIFASIFVSIPIIFYKVWRSFAPLFRPKGLKSTFPVFLTSLVLFYLGAFFAILSRCHSVSGFS